MRVLQVLLLTLFLLLSTRDQVFAKSSYVLPYPSYMPGSIYYKAHQIWEKLSQYWYFGSFGQYAYNLKQSDKYLVEAKTLFEYKQYLLAYSALKQSDKYFINISKSLKNAQKENKNIFVKKIILMEASSAHREVLTRLKSQLPKAVSWNPENKPSTDLDLHKAIDQSILVRDKNL